MNEPRPIAKRTFDAATSGQDARAEIEHEPSLPALKRKMLQAFISAIDRQVPLSYGILFAHDDLARSVFPQDVVRIYHLADSLAAGGTVESSIEAAFPGLLTRREMKTLRSIKGRQRSAERNAALREAFTAMLAEGRAVNANAEVARNEE